jgi:hypothetical protein
MRARAAWTFGLTVAAGAGGAGVVWSAACGEPRVAERAFVGADAAPPPSAAIDAAADASDAAGEASIAPPVPEPRSREPVTIATGLEKVVSIALDESDAWVLARAATAWRLWRVPKRGGAASRVDDFHADAVSIAVDANSLFVATAALISEAIQGGAFRTSAYGRVLAASKTDSTRTTVFDGLRGARAVATDGTNVYWASGPSDVTGSFAYDAVMKWRAGTAAAFFATKQLVPRSIAADATGVYWSVTGRFDDKKKAWPAGAIVRGSGAAPSTLTTTGGEPRDVALDDTSVYWLEDDRLARVAKSGGTRASVADKVERFAVDARGVCIARGATIELAPRGGEASRWDAGADVTAVALDASFVYFAAAGELRRAPR